MPAPEPIHVDAHLLVFNKPAGLLSVPGRGPDKQDCLSARVQARWPEALVVHRLDQATSGLIVLARSLDVQRALSSAFAKRLVEKTYEAVVAGTIAPMHGWAQIDAPLAADWPRRPRQQIDWQHGKPSQTHWRASQPGPLPGTTRLLMRPVTGRSHQLRVHMASIGHAIVGDALYASAEVEALAPRLLLHACQLTLAHPVSGARLSLHAPTPF